MRYHTQGVARWGMVLLMLMGSWADGVARPVDSTYVQGVAPQGVAPPPVLPVGAISPAQMLQAMQGAELYFREYNDARTGYIHLPAYVRVKVYASRADLQLHQRQAGWQTFCSVTPENPVCDRDRYGYRGMFKLQLTPNVLFLSVLPCLEGESGLRYGEANYSWEAFLAGVGAFEGLNRRLQPSDNGYTGFWFQNSSIAGACYGDYSY